MMTKENNKEDFYPFRVNFLPENFYQMALEELNETPETRRKELQKLKDLLSADGLTSDIAFEVDFLYLFLRHTKYNSQRAFQNLQKYIKFRRSSSSLFQSVPDDCFERKPSSEFISVLPYRSPDGCAIVLHEFGKWNPNEIAFDDFKRICFLSFFQPLRCPMTQICGFKIIYDFKDTVKHFRYCTPQNLSLVYNAAFNCLPARYKEVHFINKTAVLTVLWSLLKHVIPVKMKQRFFFHSSPEDLLNHFPESILPAQYGGSLKDYHDAELTRKLNEGHSDLPLEGVRNYF